MECKDCKCLLTNATGWHKECINGVWQWWCLRCSGKAKPVSYPMLQIIWWSV